MKMKHLDGIARDGFYKYVTENYKSMEKEDLKDCIREICYALYEKDEMLYKSIQKSALNELTGTFTPENGCEDDELINIITRINMMG